MNLIQQAMQAVFGKAKSKAAMRRREQAERGFAPGARATKPASRQAVRRELFRVAMAAVNEVNLRRRYDRDGDPDLVGMPRAERRNLARAYAKGHWRKTARVAVK